MIIRHLFTFDYYAAFLKASGLTPSELASGYMQYEGKDLQSDLAKTEQLGFYKNGKITVKAEKIAKVICEPEKTILVDNAAASENGLCIYNYYKGFWVYLIIDYKLRLVSLTSPLLPNIIKPFVISSTFGNWHPASSEKISFSLTNDELSLLNISLFVIGKAFKTTGRPLTKEESMVNLKVFDKKFLAELMTANIFAENALLNIYEDENRYQNAVSGLLNKGFLTATETKDTYLPGEKTRKYMLPDGGNVRISYKDLATGNHRKYFLTTERLFEITEESYSIQFTTVENIDLTFWETAPFGAAQQAAPESKPAVTPEPVTTQQTAQVIQPVTAPQPAQVTQPVVAPLPEPVIQPIAAPQPEPVVQPIAAPPQPVAAPQPEPIIQPVTAPQPSPVAQPTATPQTGFTFKFCPFCGSKVVMQGLFCTNCGKKFPER